MMRTRRLVIDVLYDDANTDRVEIILDKMTTDWLHSEGIAEWKETLSEPQEVTDKGDWEYFWEYDSETDTWHEVP